MPIAELGQVNAKEIAALAGVAPMNWDSGIKNGNRMIRVAASTFAMHFICVPLLALGDRILWAHYKIWCGAGRIQSHALTAGMRKMIIIANTLIAENRKWQIECPC
ncbi:MAG: hypothetical protein R3E13_03830 [Alphaproteobacteria bacterium]